MAGQLEERSCVHRGRCSDIRRTQRAGRRLRYVYARVHLLGFKATLFYTATATSVKYLNHFALVFTARRYSSAVCVCVSVCLSVCLSQIGVLLKRLNIGSRKQRHTIPSDYGLLTPKTSAKLKRSHPKQRRQMQVGRSKLAT